MWVLIVVHSKKVFRFNCVCFNKVPLYIVFSCGILVWYFSCGILVWYFSCGILVWYNNIEGIINNCERTAVYVC